MDGGHMMAHKKEHLSWCRWDSLALFSVFLNHLPSYIPDNSPLCIIFHFLLFTHLSSSFPIRPLSFPCPLSVHSSLPQSFSSAASAFLYHPFHAPIHPCIPLSVAYWWTTVDALSLTWWEISVTFSKGHHVNTKQTHALYASSPHTPTHQCSFNTKHA